MRVYPNTYSPPAHIGAGHQQTVSTSTSCNWWLSLAEPNLKVAQAGRNRSLVARTSMCGCAIILFNEQRVYNARETSHPIGLKKFRAILTVNLRTYIHFIMLIIWRIESQLNNYFHV